jgi:glycerophosphoryl diester phosphodiesterase
MIIFGHRGAKDEVSENTLKSFQSAIDNGLGALELDIHKTSDGELVVIHDPTLDRTTNGQGEVLKNSLAQIKSLDAGEGEKVPLLSEVFDLIIDNDVEIFIEIKALDCEEALAALIVKYQFEQRVIIKCFNHRALQKVHSLNTKIRKTPLMYGLPIDPVHLIDSCYSQGISLNVSLIDTQLVKEVHEAGKFVVVWNVNTVAMASHFKNMGVDYIGTDCPSVVNPRTTS